MKLLSLQCSNCHQRKSLMIGHDAITLVSEGTEAWLVAATTAEEQLKTAFGLSYKVDSVHLSPSNPPREVNTHI